MLRILDLYSGIGGFSKAFEDVSSEHFKTHAFCEIDKYAQLVLKKHWRPKKINTQYMKKLTPSPELAKFLGSSSPVQRTAVVQKIWNHIKKNNLQKPTNKRNIMVDDILKPILLKNEVTMFELAGLIGRNLK